MHLSENYLASFGSVCVVKVAALCSLPMGPEVLGYNSGSGTWENIQRTLQLFDSPNATLVSLVSAVFLFVSDRLLLPSVVSHPAGVCAFDAKFTGSGKGYSLFGKDGLIMKTHEYLEVSWFDLMQELCSSIRRRSAKTSWIKASGGLKV